WIQNWAPNLKSNLEFPVLGVRGGATACVSLLTDTQGRYHRPRQAVLPLQSGDWGGATAPARRFHRLSVYRGGATAPARRFHRLSMYRGGATAPARRSHR
ncbi:unnamed protein product, partial [Musa textilis]